MRLLGIAFLMLAVVAPAWACSLEGSHVELSSPAVIAPNTSYTFEFDVYCESVDNEWVARVLVTFPHGFVPDVTTMGFDEIEPGRPSLDMYLLPDGRTCVWQDNDGGYGEIWPGESCRVWIDVTTASSLQGEPIEWCLEGDVWGDPPHEVCGSIDLMVTAAEEGSWAAIKSLYGR